MTDENTSKCERILYYDILNILACIAVISLHHNGIVHTYSNTLRWKLALVVEVMAYWAVPVFLMLSGATLMDYRKHYDTKTFLKKRVLRTVIPFLFWSIVVLVWKICTKQYLIEAVTLRNIINIILNFKMEGVYWYFPFLFSVYLMMPILSCLSDNAKVVKYAISIMFIFQSTIMPITRLVGIEWNSNYGLPMHSYLIFVLLGHFLSKTDIKFKQRQGIYFCGMCGVVIRYRAIYTLSIRDGAKNVLFFNYGLFPSVMLACAVFVFAKYYNWEKLLKKFRINHQFVKYLSSCSLGVYLIHRIVMYYELKLLASWGISDEKMVWRTAWILCTYLISVFIISGLKKIPIMKYVIQ